MIDKATFVSDVMGPHVLERVSVKIFDLFSSEFHEDWINFDDILHIYCMFKFPIA